MSDKDQSAQSQAARFARALDRRSFLSRAAAVTAGGIATIVIGQGLGAEDAFAHASTPCYPPCGKKCANCNDNGTCVSPYSTCTTGMGVDQCCVYASGWWYTIPNANGGRHKCYDCRVYGPIVCNGAACTGLCGCKSTIHY